jgi:acyl-CoA synthetase (NDP forming)
VEELLKVVPHTASVGNPVDLTFSKNPNDYTEILPKILLSDPNVHAMFIYMLLPVQRVLQTIQSVTPDREQAAALAAAFISERCRAVASLQERYGKPVVGGSFYTRSEPFIRELQDLGVPVLPSPERAMNALAALVRYADFRRETATS